MLRSLKRFFLGKFYFLSNEEKSKIKELEKKMFHSEKTIHQIEHFKETMDKTNQELINKIQNLKTTLIAENEELKATIKAKDKEIAELQEQLKK